MTSSSDSSEQQQGDPDEPTTSSAAAANAAAAAAYPESSEAPIGQQGGRVDNNHSEERRRNDQPNNFVQDEAITREIESGGLGGWASYLVFGFAGRLLALGSNTSVTLEEDDLDGICKAHRSQHVCDTLRRNWERSRTKMGGNGAQMRGRRKGVTLLKALVATFGWSFVLSGVITLVENAVLIAQAIMLGQLIQYFDDDNAESWEGWVYALAVVAGGIVSSFCHHHWFFVGETVGMNMKTSTTTILYDKILRLRLSSLGETTSGHLVNLVTNDAQRFQFFAEYFNFIWVAPLAAVATLLVGLHLVGPSFFAGFMVLLLLIPLQAVFSQRFTDVRQRVALLTDERVKLTNQVIAGARLMKLNAWEPTLEKEIRRIRAEEVRVLKKATLLRAVNEALFFVQPAVQSCFVFSTYHLLGNELTARKVFTTLALLNNIQLGMGKFFPLAVQTASDGWVSISRIEGVLLMEETKETEGLVAPPLYAGGNLGLNGCLLSKERPCDRQTYSLSTSHPAAADAIDYPMSTATGTKTETQLPKGGAAFPVEFDTLDPMIATSTVATPTITAPTTRKASTASTPSTGGEAGRDGVQAAAKATNEALTMPAFNRAAAAKLTSPEATANEHQELRTLQTSSLTYRQVGEADADEAVSTQGVIPSTIGNPGGAQGHGDSDDTSRERPGFVSVRGACFRWTTEKAHRGHLNRAQGKVEVPIQQSTSRGSTVSSNRHRFFADEPEAGVHHDRAGLVLDDINLEIEPGMLIGVVGAVGSSKSSLLMALLREIIPQQEEDGGERKVVSVGGTVAYAAQEPWIQSGTLRENILFGRPMDRERYESVLRDCSLERDLSTLPSGDMTGIGDRGVNLSGGQKARVGLARMAYAHADVYLMDDPLSAVDPAVARELFSGVLRGRLSGSTRLLVTHQVHHLKDPAVDAIVVMDHGKILARGSYDDLEASGIMAALERPMTPHNELMPGDEKTPGSGRFHFSSSSAASFAAATPHSTNTLTPSGFAHEQPASNYRSAQRGFTTSPSPQQQKQQQQEQGQPERSAQAVNSRHEHPQNTMRTSEVPSETNSASTSFSASAVDEGRFGMERGDGNGGGSGGGGDGGDGGVGVGGGGGGGCTGEGVCGDRRVARDDGQHPLRFYSDPNTNTATAGSKPRDRSVKRWLSGLKVSVSTITASSTGRYRELTSPRTGAVEGMDETAGSKRAGLVREMGNTPGRRATSKGTVEGMGKPERFEERGRATDALGGTTSTATGIPKSESSMHFSEASLPRVSAVTGEEERGEPERNAGDSELVVAEKREAGAVHLRTYSEYLREAAGPVQMAAMFASLVGAQVLTMSVTVWLAKWARQSKEEQQRTSYITVLVLLTLATTLVSFFRDAITLAGLVKASHRLHDRMLHRIIRAPVLFFDSNPVGRILNRFTKDVDFMDDSLPMTMYDFAVCTLMVIGGTLIVFVVNPWVILSLLPAAGYFRYLQRFCVQTSRQLKRLDAVSRSPVFSQLSETLDGLVTIRAFGMQRRFMKRFTERVDVNTRAYFACLSTSRWLAFRLNVVVIIILTASCFFSVAVNELSGDLDAGLLGAALVYMIQLCELFQWNVKQSAEMENQMVSVERVLDYCKVPQEASLESEKDNKPSNHWPEKGNIEIRHLVMRYREDMPPALKGLSLSIKGGSRVGVVGRTGAGKSSLITALFRLVEYDRNSGGLEIDGVDISKLGLHDLRARMSVVPQTPFLFSGSMRLNLDPFKTQSDLDMWAALEAVQMKGYVYGLPGGLDALVSEGGGNLSVGQRQLLCLARAVLQRSQIMVMDEATANIDQNTDFLIQNVVRTRFKGKTVIMIAHRLRTVIDCDQVVVISGGRVVEAGHPHMLLQASAATAAAAAATAVAAAAGGTSDVHAQQAKGSLAAGRMSSDFTPVGAFNSTFSSMVEETGPASSEELRRLAKAAWKASGSGQSE